MPAVTITYDPRGTYLPEHGLAPDELTKFSPQLTAARNEVLADAQLWADGVTPPSNKDPLDAGFHHMPERLLAEYQSAGPESEVGRIIATANRLAAVVDRAVVLGIGGSYMGARALLESCCHPYYNELPRPLRDNRPRISFEGNNVDNDALQGLLRLAPLYHVEQ